MRHTSTFLFALLLALTLTSAAFAQDPGPAEQKPATPAETDAEKPKSEVDKLIDEAGKRGEKVLTLCLDPAGCGDESSDQVLNLEKGRAISLPKPPYPPIARAAHAQGSVEVQVIIDEEGKVIAAAAVSGHPLLQAVCVMAARNSRFTTSKLEGVPVKVTGVLRYNFVTQ